jgi:hypothetical protein
MFLDVALEDLGKWVGPLSKDDWLREDVVITPSEDAAHFDSTKWTMFRDPWLEQIEVLPLETSPLDIVAKAWLTIPTAAVSTDQVTSATPTISDNVGGVEGASDSAFAGKLADLTHSFGAGAVSDPTVATTPPIPAHIPPATPAAATFVMPTGPISIPNLSEDSTPEAVPEPQPVETTPTQDLSPTKVAAPIVEQSQVEEIPVIEETGEQATKEQVNNQQNAGEGVEILTELTDIIQLLKVGGLETEQILESPAFVEVSERATAAGLDVWTILMENAT